MESPLIADECRDPALDAPFAFWLMPAAQPVFLASLGTHNEIVFAGFCQSVLRDRRVTTGWVAGGC
jgi:hypothetical protein